MNLNQQPSQSRHASVALYEAYIFMAYGLRHAGAMQLATQSYHQSLYPHREADVTVPELSAKVRRKRLTNQLGLVVIQSLRELEIPRYETLARAERVRLGKHLEDVTYEASLDSQRFFDDDPRLHLLEFPLLRPWIVESLCTYVNQPKNQRISLPLDQLLGAYAGQI